jgi:hypothetical protein
MSADSPLGRRLRFDLEMYYDESVPGAIARGVRDHVLIRTQPVLAAAGVRMKHIGYAQLATSAELERLAHVARCRPEAFVDRAGSRILSIEDGPSIDARFGDLILPRAYLELERRRIGPTSLRSRRHHRINWMNRLLPYCPESLERLVERCATCETSLGWRFALGIGHCEYCGTEIAPSEEPGLPEARREDFTLFAALSCPDGRSGAEARQSLPTVLADAGPGTLVRLALLAGGLVQDKPVKTTSRVAVVDLDAPILASVAAAGAALLRDWPVGFRTWVSDRSEKLRDSPEQFEELRIRLKRLVHARSEAPDLIKLVKLAVPNIEKHKSHGLVHGRRYYLYSDVQRVLGWDAELIRALRNWSGIRFVNVSSAPKNRMGQFDANQIDELATVFRGMVAMNSCTGRFKLPYYAIEQLCGAGLLEWEDHGAVLATTAWYGVRRASVDRLESALINAAESGRRPSDCLPLAVAMKGIGGRTKPWSAVIRSLESGQIQFWISGSKPTSRSLFVRPAGLAPLADVAADMPPLGFKAADTISQLDAAEVLNISAAVLERTRNELDIPFEQKGRALVAPIECVIAVARSLAWAGEISRHLKVGGAQVARIMRQLGIENVANGWCRDTLVLKGLLPPLPGSDLLLRD